MNLITNLITTKFLSLIIIVIFGITFSTYAQEEEAQSKPVLSISGSIDAYYRANISGGTNDASKVDSEGASLAPSTSFTNKTGFTLGMANLVLGLEEKKTGFVADLVLGPRGTDAVFSSTTSSSSVINQLYVYWNVSDKVTLTLGNFNTFLGYEVISPVSNFNYSTSYMFSYGPFSHSGLKADFSLGKVSAMLAVMNPTDATDFNPSNDYVLGAQLGFGGAYVNYIYSEDFYQIDLTAGWDLTDSFYLGVNATKAKDSFSGVALYLQTAFSDAFGLGLRGEYFKDEGVDTITKGETVVDLTLSVNYSIGDFKLIPEFRVDLLSYDGFIESSEGMDGSNMPINAKTGKSLSSFTLAAIYAF